MDLDLGMNPANARCALLAPCRWTFVGFGKLPNELVQEGADAMLLGWFKNMKCCSQPSSLLVKLVLAWKTTQVSFFETCTCNFCRNGLLFVILSRISNNMTKYRWFGLISKFNLQKQVTSPWSVNWRGTMWITFAVHQSIQNLLFCWHAHLLFVVILVPPSDKLC